MSASTRRWIQLLLAILVLAGAVALAWKADDAMNTQYRVLRGCWPERIILNGARLTVDFWSDYVEKMKLGPVSEFFHSRTRHRIIFYLLVLCSLIGWSGSIFRRIVTAKENAAESRHEVPGWAEFIASFALSALAGAILFLLFVGTRLIYDPQGTACIKQGFVNLAMAGGIACGLFVVLFFHWFEGQAESIWGRLSGNHKE
jgi:hypothetical protein